MARGSRKTSILVEGNREAFQEGGDQQPDVGGANEAGKTGMNALPHGH